MVLVALHQSVDVELLSSQLIVFEKGRRNVSVQDVD